MAVVEASKNTVRSVGRASIDGVRTLIFPAKLVVTNDLVQLKAFLSIYEFKPEQVGAIEAASPDQIYIRHIIRNYPTLVSFSSPGILEQLQRSSFVPEASAKDRSRVLVDGSSYKLEIALPYFLVWFILVQVLSLQGVWLALTLNVIYGFVPLVAILASKRIRLLLLQPGVYFVDVALQTFFCLLGVLLMSSWLVISPTACDKYENLCKPEWSWSMFR